MVVSKSIRDRFSHANIGDTMEFGKGKWKVVGVFDAGGSAYESEIWGDVNQMASDFDRQGGYASAYLRATDPVAADALKNRVSDDQRLKLDGMLETEYYAKQTSSGAPIKYIGIVVAVIMAIGSSFAAMNTMYAAVAYRGREIATLRVLGFSRPAILTSFVLESLMLALLGALAGILLMLPFNGMQTGTSNAVTFSEVVFSLQITPAGGRRRCGVCAGDGTGGRVCSRVACRAAEYSDCVARLSLRGTTRVKRYIVRIQYIMPIDAKHEDLQSLRIDRSGGSDGAIRSLRPGRAATSSLESRSSFCSAFPPWPTGCLPAMSRRWKWHARGRRTATPATSCSPPLAISSRITPST